MKILIVCYDAFYADLTGKILKRSGHGSVCCRGADKVLTEAEFDDVGLVIADLESDESERIKFCKAVKSAKNAPKLLFIGRSGEDEIPMLNAGADDWIKKPYKTDVFLARVSALIRQYDNNF